MKRKETESENKILFPFSLMTFLLNGSEGLDRIKCMEMALVHDLAESLVGDITPYCGVSKKDKEVLEMEAIHKICGLIEPRGEHILQLFYVSRVVSRVSSCSLVVVGHRKLRPCQKYSRESPPSACYAHMVRVATIFTSLSLVL